MTAEQWHFYEAEVKVKNRATLRPDANLNDGDIVKVQYGWLMDDTEMFPGQIAFLPHRGYWIPEEDLIILKEIPLSEYFEHQPIASTPTQSPKLPQSESKP